MADTGQSQAAPHPLPPVSSMPLRGPGLAATAALMSPRGMMQLPTWSRAAQEAVGEMHPKDLDLHNGAVAGRKVAVTWRERREEMAAQAACIARLPAAGELLSPQEIHQACSRAREELRKEPNVIHVEAPVVVVGNITGQFLDLLEIFAICGPVPEVSYLFLGSYVNRGYDSCRTASLLMLLKARYPSRCRLLRGKHECRNMTNMYGFYDECMKRYGHDGPEVWKDFMDCFDYLPLTATVGSLAFCVHGGLSPEVDTLDELREIDRMKDVPHEGPVCDMLWGEPDDRVGWGIVPKGCGYTFGEDITKEFLHKAGRSLLARSNQLVIDGYQYSHDGRLVTVYSAPNFCNRCRNHAAVMEVGEDSQPSFQSFAGVRWPEWPV